MIPHILLHYWRGELVVLGRNQVVRMMLAAAEKKVAQ